MPLKAVSITQSPCYARLAEGLLSELERVLDPAFGRFKSHGHVRGAPLRDRVRYRRIEHIEADFENYVFVHFYDLQPLLLEISAKATCH